MEIADVLRLLRRNWLVIVACAVLGLVCAAAVSFSIRPTYTAKTELFVAIQSSGSVADLQQGNTFTQSRVESYVDTVDTPAVLQPVIDSLGLDAAPSTLAKQVEASADLNTVILSIQAESDSPVQAAAIAQAVADSLVVVIEELESPADGGPSPVRLSVITPASAPAEPSSPDIKVNLILGLVAGLTLGGTWAVGRTLLDTKIRGELDLKRVTDAPILGSLAYDGDSVRKPLLTQALPRSPRAESFRQLRTNLQFSHVEHKSRAILVTSSVPGEGKSTTAVNLAIAIAQSGQSVVLVDADLRRPRVSEYLGLERNAGLTTALVGRAELPDLLQPWGEEELYVLTSGQIPPNPSELLGSKAMKRLINDLEGKFDAVIIDAPPLLPVTDAAVLAQEVGGVVMVVGATKVRVPELQKAFGALDMVEADVLGVVMNLLPTRGPDAYSYTYYESNENPSDKPLNSPRRPQKKQSQEHEESDFDDRVLRGYEHSPRDRKS